MQLSGISGSFYKQLTSSSLELCSVLSLQLIVYCAVNFREEMNRSWRLLIENKNLCTSLRQPFAVNAVELQVAAYVRAKVSQSVSHRRDPIL